MGSCCCIRSHDGVGPHCGRGGAERYLLLADRVEVHLHEPVRVHGIPHVQGLQHELRGKQKPP